MADLADAIAAAEQAAEADPTPNAPQAPHSPPVKPEPNIEDIPMAGVEEQTFAAPMKRSRSPQEHHGNDFPTEKRLKTETVAQDDSAAIETADDMDEFARLVQQAQDSVMQDDYIQLEGDPMSSATGDFLDSAAVSIIDLEEALLSMPPTRTESIWNGTHHFTRRKHVLPALGSLAVDVLIAWSEQSLDDTLRTLCHNRDSEVAREYVCLKTAFDAQRRYLSEDSLLLDPYSLGVYGGDREIVRVANLAASCASLFSTLDIGLEEVNDQFLMIFIPQGHDLSQDAADIFLALKTQIFLAMLDGQQERTRDEILDEVFPSTMQSILEAHHMGWPLNSIETQFLADAEARKTMLRNGSDDADSIQALSKQFSYETFLEYLNSYLNDNIESIKMQGAGIIDLRPGFEHEGPHDVAPELDFDFDLDAAIAEASRAAETDSDPNADVSGKDEDLTEFLTASITKAAEEANGPEKEGDLTSEVNPSAESASMATMQVPESISHNENEPGASVNESQPASQATTSSQAAIQRQPQQYYPYPQHTHQPHPGYRSSVDHHLPPNQSDSTPALYERARQAAAARSSTQARREGTHSTRRPWSPEEEKALMMGLDMVKGPHWSQILGLFGPNGSISQILADRTQVQLKDKARNLKLFFLKANTEMPYYLQCVTGELKTRAPTQAARKEAEEKAKEEQHGHIPGGVHSHAGVHNHNSQTPTRPPIPMATTHSTTPVQSFSHLHLPAGAMGAHHSIRPPVSMAAGAPRPTFFAAQPVQLPIKMLQSPQQSRPPATSPAPPPVATARSTPQPTPTLSEAAFSGTSIDGTPQEDLSIEDAALLDLQALLDGDIPEDLAGDVNGELAAALNGDSNMEVLPTEVKSVDTNVPLEQSEATIKEEPSPPQHIEDHSTASGPESNSAATAVEPLQSGFLEKEEDDILLDLQAAIDKEAMEADAANGEHHGTITESVESETDLFDIQAAIEREAAQHAAAEENSHQAVDSSLMDFQMTMEREPTTNVSSYRATSSTTA